MKDMMDTFKRNDFNPIRSWCPGTEQTHRCQVMPNVVLKMKGLSFSIHFAHFNQILNVLRSFSGGDSSFCRALRLFKSWTQSSAHFYHSANVFRFTELDDLGEHIVTL